MYANDRFKDTNTLRDFTRNIMVICAYYNFYEYSDLSIFKKAFKPTVFMALNLESGERKRG